MIPVLWRLCYSKNHIMGVKSIISILLLVIAGVIGVSGIASAQQSYSPNYSVNEYYFGTGGELDASSANYRAKQSSGELAVGHAESASYQAHVGFNTSDEPILEVAVNGDVDFGVLDSLTTAKGEANIQVRTYLATGYEVILSGPPPTYSGRSLATPAMPTESNPGTEQFGVNLVANSTPQVGADPVQVPDSSFSFGWPLANYLTENEFMYQDGASVASSNKSSGQTNYTLSMIANVADSTPAGRYSTAISVVVVSTF